MPSCMPLQQSVLAVCLWVYGSPACQPASNIDPRWASKTDPFKPKFSLRWSAIHCSTCRSAWNKDPLFLGDRHPIGTPGIRAHTGLLIFLGGRVPDADCGDDSLAYFSRKMTIKAICRDLRVSRKV